jgi:hypothetical protein
MKPIHILKAGKHRDIKGIEINMSDDDLAAIAKQYSRAVFEAPLVVGHPELNSPAFGWIERITANAEGLWAHPEQINPEFAEAVQEGRYKKVSASFYLKDSPGNPKPGALYLRHVGFLGGAAPAIKGLTPVSFSEADGVIEFADIEFAIQEKNMLNGQDTNSPAAQIEALKARATELEKENETLRAEEKQRKTNAKHAEYAEEVKNLVRQGRIIPAVAPVLMAAMDLLNSPDNNTANFGEGSEAKPIAKALLDQLKASPPVVNFAEISGAQGDGEIAGHVAFIAPAGYTYDPAAAAQVARAKARMKTTPALSFAEALEASK